MTPDHDQFYALQGDVLKALGAHAGLGLSSQVAVLAVVLGGMIEMARNEGVETQVVLGLIARGVGEGRAIGRRLQSAPQDNGHDLA